MRMPPILLLSCGTCLLAGAVLSRLYWQSPGNTSANASRPPPAEEILPHVDVVLEKGQPALRGAMSTSPYSAAGLHGPEDLQKQVADQVAEYDRRFKSEPVSAVWAANSELFVRNAFSTDEAVRMGITAPRDAHIECRSSTCRIEAVYDSDGAASDASQLLLMDIAEQLPRAKLTTFQNPDGSSRLVIFANRTTLPKPTADGTSPSG